MAGKSRRVASRQSQLNQRKKRQQRGPSGIPATEPLPVGVDSDGSGDAPLDTMSSAAATTAVATAPATAVPARRVSARSRDDRTASYAYMGSEFRRILIMAGIGFAVLVILKFVLP
jgi:hypothetical protein